MVLPRSAPPMLSGWTATSRQTDGAQNVCTVIFPLRRRGEKTKKTFRDAGDLRTEIVELRDTKARYLALRPSPPISRDALNT